MFTPRESRADQGFGNIWQQLFPWQNNRPHLPPSKIFKQLLSTLITTVHASLHGNFSTPPPLLHPSPTDDILSLWINILRLNFCMQLPISFIDLSHFHHNLYFLCLRKICMFSESPCCVVFFSN